jgi:hypothetical protein
MMRHEPPAGDGVAIGKSDGANTNESDGAKREQPDAHR